MIVLITICGAESLCSTDVYDSYLGVYPVKCEGDCDEYKRLHFPDFKKSCQHMVSKQPYTPYQMEFTMLSDFSEEDLDEVMDVKQKHSRRGSYYEPIEAKEEAVEPAFTTMDRDFCSEDAELREYAKPNNCSLSWVTMIVNAGERALAMIGGSEKLSAAFVKKCYAEGDACNGLGMAGIAEDLKKIGLVTEREANRVLKDRGDLCSIPQSKRFSFKVLKAEGPNRGGLMNLIGEGNPVLTLLSIDLNRLRFVKDMREEDVTLSGTVYEPSLYGLVTGYVKTTEEVDGYWVVEGTPSPCESVNVKVPMRDNETNSDYAGIAGYAFAIEFNGKRDFVVPSEGLTSVDAIPSFAQSIVFAANSFSELSEVDFSRFRELKELVFGANSFANVGSLELVGLHKLESLRFEAGAFANGFNLVLDDLTSLVDLQYSEGCFTGKPSGRRLAEVSGYGIRISGCSSLRRITIPGGSFTHATVVSMVNLSAVEEVRIEEGALPKVEVMNMTSMESLSVLSIGKNALVLCESMTMVDVAIKAKDLETLLDLSKECLKALQEIIVNNVKEMIEIAEAIKKILDRVIDVVIPGKPTSVPTTTAPTPETPTIAPTEEITPTPSVPSTVIPTTVIPTTVAPTTETPTTVAPTTETPTTVAPTTVTPTTMAPTTVTPTVAPTTVSPTTVAPTTETPTTVVPTTVAPTTVAPTTVLPTTIAPTTVTPTTIAPTTVAPTTVIPSTETPTTILPTTTPPTTVVPPTVVPPTTETPTSTPTPIPTQSPSKGNDCWSAGIPLNATEIIIPDNSCNGEEDTLDLSQFSKVKTLTVGNNCFGKLSAMELFQVNSLESITIGMNSFNGD
ncbi:hypothetical protein WA577_006948 [Blastocystis sp. JDR]